MSVERESIDLIRVLRKATELNSLVVPVGGISPNFFDEIGILLTLAPFMQKLEFFMAKKCPVSYLFNHSYSPEILKRADLF